jgi:hypothetical protein
VADVPTRGNHARILQPITGETIATVYGSAFSDVPTDTEKANAAFIVEACNAYDTLRADNKRLRDVLETVLRDIPDHQASGTYADIRNAIRAALGKDGDV